MCGIVVHQTVPHTPWGVRVLWYHSIPSLHPTRADHSVLWVWWMWVGVKVNVTVMHHLMAIHRPSIMQTITMRYPEVRVTFDMHVGH